MNKPAKSCPKGMKQIRSVIYNKSRRDFSFSKLLKRTETYLAKSSHSISESSLEKKVRYFYQPYNHTGDYAKWMRFENHDDEVLSKHKTNTLSGIRRSCWRKVSKIIIKGDNEIFKKMMRELKGRTSSSKKGRKGTKEGEDDKTKSDCTTPIKKLSSNQNLGFSAYFKKFRKLVIRDENNESSKMIQRRKMRTKRKPKIIISKLSSKFSPVCNLNKKLTVKQNANRYQSSKNNEIEELESVHEKCNSHETSSISSAEPSIVAARVIRPRLLSPVLKMKNPLTITQEFKEAKEKCNNKLTLLAQRPKVKPPVNENKKGIRVRRFRHMSPTQIMTTAYSPILKANKNG